WDIDTGKQLQRFNPAGGPVTFSPDGKLLATSIPGNFVCLWDVASGKEVRRFKGLKETVTSIAFAVGGKVLAATGEENREIRVWGPATGKGIAGPAGHHGIVMALPWAPDGKTVFSCGLDRRVLEWDMATGRERGRLYREPLGPRPYWFFRAVDLAPDGKLVAQV